jgi:hypothetical protein
VTAKEGAGNKSQYKRADAFALQCVIVLHEAMSASRGRGKGLELHVCGWRQRL